MKEILKKFINNENEKIYLYGASSSGLRVLNNLIFMDISSERLFFIDSNPQKQGTMHGGRPVLTMPEFKALEKNSKILITSCMHYEIEPYLFKLGFSNYFYIKGLVYSDKMFEKFDQEFVNIIELIKNKANIDYDELYTIYSSLKATSFVDGSVAEVGVYKGGSSFLLAKLIKNKGKDLYLFDTYEGIPEPEKNDLKGEPDKGWLSNTSVEEVKKFVLTAGIESKRLFLKKGYFPSTAVDMENEKFSLVHLDTDMYDGTLNSLKFFYPKLNNGGRIIIHDYNCCGCPGVKLAVNDYMQSISKSESIIEISESQALICK